MMTWIFWLLFSQLIINSTSTEIQCAESEFQCLDKKQCIPSKLFCDGTANCEDKSDEVRYQSYPANTIFKGIPCRQFYYTCILPSHMISKKDKICGKDLTCGLEEFKCSDTSGCLPSPWFCGGINDCADGSDENQYIDQDPRGTILHSGCLLDPSLLCDNNKNFKNGIDECLCPKTPKRYSDDKCFRCLLHSHIVLRVGKLCDGIIDCPDASDECMCGKHRNMDICNMIHWDASDGERSITQSLTCDSTISRMVDFPIDVVCNGRVDCKNGMDERNCSKECESEVGRRANPNCGRYKCSIFGKQATSCDGIPVCASDMYGEECSPNCTNKPKLCDYVEEMPTKKGWTRVKCDVLETSFSYLDGVQLCDGRIDCKNGEDEIGCPHRFYCKSKSPYSIPQDKVCDQELDCDDASDEPDSCSLRCNDDGDVDFVSLSQICDGTKNCKYGLDECEPGCVATAFSNNEYMIANRGVLALVSIISLMALFGNMSVIVHTIKDFRQKNRMSNEVEKLSKLLVFNLSISDLLVGIFTTAICLKAATDSERYCLQDREWRSSKTCSALGVLIVIGSEQSVFTMILITAFRIHAVSKLHPVSDTKPYAISLGLSWLLSILLAVIPEFQSLDDYFVDAISYDGNKLFATIRTPDKQELTNWLLLTQNSTGKLLDNYGYIGSWSLLKHLIVEVNPNYILHRRFGFYSTHSVCLPTLFPDRIADTAWVYSLFLILVNFCAFICIFVGGIIIYRKSAAKVATHKSKSQDSRSAMLRRKLTRIVISDFLCWVPVCIMAFLQISGVDIPNDAYIPVGLLVIPINSALNPFLYSNIPDIMWEKTKPARTFIKRNIFRIESKGSPQASGINSSYASRREHPSVATIRSAKADENNFDSITLETRKTEKEL